MCVTSSDISPVSSTPGCGPKHTHFFSHYCRSLVSFSQYAAWFVVKFMSVNDSAGEDTCQSSNPFCTSFTSGLFGNSCVCHGLLRIYGPALYTFTRPHSSPPSGASSSNYFASYTYTFTFSCTSSSLISVSWSPEVSALIVPSFNFHPSPYMPLTTCFRSITHNCLLNSTTTIIPSVLPSPVFPFAVSSTSFPCHPVFINHHPFWLFPFPSLRCATWSFLQRYHEKQDFHNVKISPQFTILLENRLQKWTNQKWLWLWGY